MYDALKLCYLKPRYLHPCALAAALVFCASTYAVTPAAQEQGQEQTPASAPAQGRAQAPGSLDQEIQTIKQQVLELNRDLFILEEDLLFPSNTRLSVYLSLDIGEFFSLDAVKLSVNGTVVTNYLYTERQLSALQRGGVQRLYMGNIKAGEHEIVAVFTGRGLHLKDRQFFRSDLSLLCSLMPGNSGLS